MEYRKLGNSGTVVSALCLGTMTFGAEADEATSHRDPRRLRRGRRQLHRHRRRLLRPAPPRRSSAAGSPPTRPRRAQHGRRHQGPLPDGARPERPRHLAPPPRRRARRLAEAARHRADRPLPDARLGRADPARGDAALPRRRDPRRQDRLLRLLQLPRLAGHQGGARRQGRRLRPAGDAAAAVQPAGPRHRARDRAGLPRRRHRASCPGRRSAAAGSPASTSATWRRPAPPASARTPSAAWRPTRRATPASAPGAIIDAVTAVAKARGVSPAEVALAWVAAAAGGHLGDPRRPHHRAARRRTSRPPTSP